MYAKDRNENPEALSSELATDLAIQIEQPDEMDYSKRRLVGSSNEASRSEEKFAPKIKTTLYPLQLPLKKDKRHHWRGKNICKQEKSMLPTDGLIDGVQPYVEDEKLLRETFLSRDDFTNLENDVLEEKSLAGNTSLHVAASVGKYKLVQQILERAPHLIGRVNSNYDTALHVAARCGHLNVLDVLMHVCSSNSINVLAKNMQGNTFFHVAVINGHTEGLTLLVSHYCSEEWLARAAWEEINNENKSILYLAIEAGCKQLVVEAFGREIMQDPSFVPRGKSPLLAAILKHDQEILDTILSRKPKWIHLRDKKGRIPLHYAASIGYKEGVDYLLNKCNSCPMKRDEDGFLPLHLASFAGHVKIVQKLLEREYCPYPMEMLDNNGRNILHLAIEGEKFEVVRYILDNTDQEVQKMINGQDANGNTPLHLATLHCHPKTALALTWNKDVNLNLVNKEYQTAFTVLQPPANPSFRQQLTRSILMSAGMQSNNSMLSPVRIPSESNEKFWQQIRWSSDHESMGSYKDRIKTLILVSTLIMTVTFAASLTVPGGSNSSFILKKAWL